MKHLRHVLQVATILLLLVALAACSQTATTSQPTTKQPNTPSNPINLNVNAGIDQELTVGDLVILDGSQSSTEANYTWKLLQKPAGSTVTLDKSFGLKTSFRPDVTGSYIAELTLSSGSSTKSDQVNIRANEFVRTDVIGANVPIRSQEGLVITPPDDVATTDVQIKTIDKFNIPLPTIYQAVGEGYSLKSKAVIKSNSNKPITVGLPVPENSQKNNLALAVLIPGEHQYGLLKKRQDFEDEWLIVDAQFDSTQNTALSNLYMLVPEQLQLTLVTHPKFSSIPTTLRTLQTSSRNFELRCSGAFDGVEANCTDQDELVGAAVFESIFAEYVSKGFTDEPALRRSWFIGNWVIDIVPNTEPWLGLYTPVLNSIQVTLNGTFDGTTDTSTFNEFTISRHEYFHAVQFSYLNPIQAIAVAFNNWSLEGQATAVMNAQTGILRFPGGFPRRDIETTLLENDFDTSSAPPYEAQDFWVFIAKSINDDMSSLERFVRRGQTADNADEAFRSTNGEFSGLGDAYWKWVKNQAFEASVDIGANDPACELNPSTVLVPGSARFFPGVNTNGVPDNILNIDIPLAPLSSKLYTLTLTHDNPANYVAYDAIVQLQDSSNNVEFKVYDAENSEQQSCVDIPDGRRSIKVSRPNNDSSSNGDKLIHVLVSNTSYSESVEVLLLVDALLDEISSDAPSLSLLQPSTRRVRESTRVLYEVEANSPNSDSTLEWFINDELVRENEVPRGRDNYSLSFVPCPQETTMRAELLEGFGNNQVVTHTMEVIPFGEVLDTDQDGRYVPIMTEGEIIIARLTAATCNDPDSTPVNLLDVQWTIDTGDPFIDDVLKFTQEEFVGINPATIGFSYPAKDPNAVRSQMIVYPCEVRSDLSSKGATLPCLSYQNQKGTEDMFGGLELLNTQKEAFNLLQSSLDSKLNSLNLKSSALSLSRKESLDGIASKFSKETASIVESLFMALESKDIATFDKSFTQLHLKIQESGFKPAQSTLILEAMGLVMTQVDEYTSRADGGNNRWAQFMFSKNPDGIIQKVNVLEPATVALDAFISVVATSGEVSGLGELTSLMAARNAVEKSQ